MPKISIEDEREFALCRAGMSQEIEIKKSLNLTREDHENQNEKHQAYAELKKRFIGFSRRMSRIENKYNI